MWEKNLTQKIIFAGVVLLIGAALLWPPQQKLRPGLDIAGGVAMIFEIDDTGLENYPGLAEEMKRLLQKRVDPRGLYNLVWRVHGRNRLEVQMPLPPPGANQAREAYRKSLETLLESNIGRGELEAVFRLPAEERASRIRELARGSAEREQLLTAAAQAYDDYRAAVAARDAGTSGSTTQPEQETAEAATTAPAQEGGEPATKPAGEEAAAEELELTVRDTEEALTDAVDSVLATNLDRSRLQDALELEESSAVRKNILKEMRARHPELVEQLNDVIARYAEWQRHRGTLDSPADLRRLMRGAGKLEFRILAEPSPDNPTQYDRYRRLLQERGPRGGRSGEPYGWFKIDSPLAFFNLDSPAELAEMNVQNPPTPVIAERYGDDYYVLGKLGNENGLLADQAQPWQLKMARADRDEMGRPCVQFGLDVMGGHQFRELTGRNVNKQLCILVDDVAYSSANIQEAIGASGRITGDFSPDKVNYLVNTMRAGALPARLKDTPVSERTIGSSLGATNLHKAFRAGLMSLIAVVAVMAVYYLVAGLVADLALVMNIILVLAAMALLNARFTLAGIAGVVLTIGMAVDANVLIYERIREERARGSSLRMMLKNGYDKALSTIIDANITTLLTCVIIYYVGSEEIKGFGLTLGWGIVLNLFTALFVSRTIFALLIKYHVIRDLKMLSLIGVPKIDWYAKRKFFVPISLLIVLIGVGLLATRSRKDLLDVEFNGGTSVEAELKHASLDDVQIIQRLNAAGDSISAAAGKLGGAEVEPAADAANTFHVRAGDVPPPLLAALIAEPLEEAGLLQRDGVDTRGGTDTVTVRVQGDVTAERLTNAIRGLTGPGNDAGKNIARSNVNSVTEVGQEQEAGRVWGVTTTATNKRLVQYALESALGDELQTRPRVDYVIRGNDGRPYPITSRKLEGCIPDLPPGTGADVSDFLGGAAIYFDQLSPPQAAEELADRFRSMRLQPDYEDLPWRDINVIGITPAGRNEAGRPLYSSVVLVVADPNLAYADDPERWQSALAQPELDLATATLDREQSLRKVSQFKPQIAQQSQTRAGLAILLSWGMIIGYLWLRFGRITYGFAGVVALVHDVLIALAFVGLSGWLGGKQHPIGAALLISDFKIDMTVVAAFLTIIGYSINDTIIVFDRIREIRGRLGIVTPEIINQAINQTLARTLLTAGTTMLVVVILYIFGGSSIRAFNFCMLIGVLTGTYSSIAIASPLLMLRRHSRRVSAPLPVPAAT